MPKRALVEHRPWLLTSLAASIAYYFLSDNPIGEIWLIGLKGAGVAFLAAYAIRRTSGLDGWILALALALSACADMALELDINAGGTLFLASHLVAVVLYLRNRRQATTLSQRLTATSLFVAAPAVSYLLTNSQLVALYAVSLGAMAGAAWLSRFPRYRVGIGAVLFVISDWLIFSRMGSFDLGEIPDLLVWPLYYLAQFLIATGIVQTLCKESPPR